MRRLSRCALVAVSALVVALPLGAAVDYSGVVHHEQTPVEGSWLVELRPEAEAAVEQIATRLGAEVAFRYEILPGVWNLRGLDDEQAALVSELPGVVRVAPDYVVKGGHMQSVPLVRGSVSQLGAAGFGAVTGAGVRICIVDSGVRHDHIVFEGRSDTSADWDFINGDDDASDDNGHGTHVAGTAAGGDAFEVGGEPWQGIAPEATIVAAKVLDAGGGGTVSAVIAGIDHCADQSSSGGRADVINLSLGGGLFTNACDDDPMAQAANNAFDAGLVVVAAAGNDCVDGALSSPACGRKVMAIGASYDSAGSSPRFGCYRGTCADKNHQADEIVCFSNQSAGVSVAAPGAPITSAVHTSTNALDTFYGTSQATPHVAGLAALLLDQDESRTPFDVSELIVNGAVDRGEPGFDPAFGHGRIDVLASLEGSPCGDGTCDAANEGPCSCPTDCGLPPTSESSCSNGVDDDCDGAADCTDNDCYGSSACPCGDGLCGSGEDSCSCPLDCGEAPATESDCTNGVDDDCDGAVDGDDSDCTGGATCGDKICEGGSEDCVSCPADCRAAKGGIDCCGDGECTGTENSRNCAPDCF